MAPKSKNQSKKDNDPTAKSEEKVKKISKKQRIQEKRKQRIEKLRQKKGQVKQQLTAAQSSTKSMGKFDRKAHQQQRKLKPKRRKQHSNFGDVQAEIQRNMEMFSLVKKSQGSKKVQHTL